MLTPEIQDALYRKVGELIRQNRDRVKIKQDLLASYVDLSRISIHNIETGKQKVQLHTLLEIAKYLQIPISDLLSPLLEMISDDVNSKQEKRINTEIDVTKTKSENITKIKEFINFAIAKDSSK